MDAAALQELDPEGTGYVTAKDLAEVMRALGNAPDAEVV
jgi:Ca2+-binding EF-hand superfamily protein